MAGQRLDPFFNGQIAERNNPDEAASGIDHGKATQLLILHQPECIQHIPRIWVITGFRL